MENACNKHVYRRCPSNHSLLFSEVTYVGYCRLAYFQCSTSHQLYHQVRHLSKSGSNRSPHHLWIRPFSNSFSHRRKSTPSSSSRFACDMRLWSHLSCFPYPHQDRQIPSEAIDLWRFSSDDDSSTQYSIFCRGQPGGTISFGILLAMESSLPKRHAYYDGSMGGSLALGVYTQIDFLLQLDDFGSPCHVGKHRSCLHFGYGWPFHHCFKSFCAQMDDGGCRFGQGTIGEKS